MSIRFQADNDLNFAIVKGVRRLEPAIDFASAQESSLDGIDDPELLKRTASTGRVLVSHDRSTMINHFRHHLAAGMSSPGLLVVSQKAPFGPIVEAILIFWTISDPEEIRDQTFHVPSLERHVFPR